MGNAHCNGTAPSKYLNAVIKTVFCLVVHRGRIEPTCPVPTATNTMASSRKSLAAFALLNGRAGKSNGQTNVKWNSCKCTRRKTFVVFHMT